MESGFKIHRILATVDPQDPEIGVTGEFLPIIQGHRGEGGSSLIPLAVRENGTG